MKRYYSEIDGLRGFLAIHVVTFHYIIAHERFDGALEWLNSFMYKGHPAPIYFFVISGLLILNSFLDEKGQFRYSLRQFYAFRVFRILPLLWAVLFYKVLTGSEPIGWKIFSNMFLLFGFTPYSFNDVPVFQSWSLFTEEIFYVTVPFVTRFLTFKNVLFGLFITLLTSSLWAELDMLYNFTNGLRWETPLNTYHYFFMGMLIYLANEKKWLDTKTIPYWAAWAVDILIVVIFLLLRKGSWTPHVMIATLLLLTAFMRKSVFNFVWRNRFLQWAGVRCYSIYLVHTEVLKVNYQDGFKELLLNVPEGNMRVAVAVIITILLTLAVAGLTFQFIEKPFIRLGKRLFLKPKDSGLQAGSPA